jgi:hypothetical protein
MPSFRDRPLSWLFIAATVCLDILLVVKDRPESWTGAFLQGQLSVVSAWAAIGAAHPLIRGAALVLSGPAVTYLGFGYDLASEEGEHVLGAALVSNVFIFITTFLGSCQWRRVKTWRFSVADLLGWMIIVAIAGATSRNVNLTLFRTSNTLVGAVLLGFPAVVIVVLLLTPSRKRDVIGFLVSAAVVAAFYISYYLLTGGGDRGVLLLAVYAYVALWVLVSRLDMREGPAMRLFLPDDSSDDHRPEPT